MYPYFVYPVGMFFVITYFWRQSKQVTAKLDEKYTPIWIELGKQTA